MTKSDKNDKPRVPATESPPRSGANGRRAFAALSLGSLGVVFGDIGTSPLYAIKECFLPSHNLTLSTRDVFGVLSLVFWSLVLIVVAKYLLTVMSADNEGEGGIVALMALVGRAMGAGLRVRGRGVFIVFGLIGASLLFADGVITPAISVLSAIEGLTMVTESFRPAVVPLTIVVLAGLFLFQKRGTAGIGAIFGPIMLVWFAAMALTGLPWIVREPRILAAVNPAYAYHFFAAHGFHAIAILGAVVLCVTGTEALYADLGHFGRWPISAAWSVIVFPALLINYFGQGALLLRQGAAAVANPFYSLVPKVALYPMVALATTATIIASQALISGAFSLARQAVQMGYSPRLTVVHTSETFRGRIYIPEVNWALMVLCVAVVLGFRTSSGLAAAYGLAVVGTMVTTTLMMLPVARYAWGWPRWAAALLMAAFLCIDLPFLAGNVIKIRHGGWFPLALGAVVFTVMITWKSGRQALGAALQRGFVPIEQFMVSSFAVESPLRVEGTAVFMTSNLDVVPPAMLHHYKHNKMFHKTVIVLSVTTESSPHVPKDKRVTVTDLGYGVFKAVARFGFMETPRVPDVLKIVAKHIGKGIDIQQTSFFLSREILLTHGKTKMAGWRKILFSFLSRNARSATDYFNIPPGRVVELGMQIEL